MMVIEKDCYAMIKGGYVQSIGQAVRCIKAHKNNHIVTLDDGCPLRLVSTTGGTIWQVDRPLPCRLHTPAGIQVVYVPYIEARFLMRIGHVKHSRGTSI